MYSFNVAGRTVASESSYEKAVAAAKSNAAAVSNAILARADNFATNVRLLRSPKARAAAASALRSTAANAAASLKFPKKSGTVNLNIGGVAVAIVKGE